MKTQHFPATERGLKDAGWLKSNFCFSFSDYYHPMRSAFGTLIAFNDDFVAPGKGFGIHPHVNTEIISVLLKGKMNHKDTLGYSTKIEAESVQIMSAGSGLRHEEYNIGDGEVNFLQIWIVPKLQNIHPRYQQRSFPKEKRKNRLTTIVSHEEGTDHCWINQNTKLSLGYYEHPQHIRYTLNPLNKCLFIFSIAGNLKVQDQVLQERDAIGVWEAADISLQCSEQAEFLIIETPVNQK
ncbi:pirin family protein [Chitinophaga nivalis]|uniref:Pirin family protein n=1 Tax=Chitinophaga nivalis TaxID=2991709 RepID=A0ABT3IGE9_9BACT|nr:pirin family protein [Chitinophaga nivalis]MCW3467292.1 pirin family protein [Chitinophaga nivalis]MCW3483016.1 pirin family protein [Chitinophaga nivalis]